MSVLLASVILFVLSLAVAAVAYPIVLKTAVNNGIMDHPNARKLQREPVPVAGGIVIFAGIIAGFLAGDIFFTIWKMSVLLTSMLILLIVGITDDAKELSPWVRLLVEVLVIYMFITGTDLFINDFGGLWGIGGIPLWLGYGLSIIAGVGILNAINLIDGVDGLCSGFCFTASAVFTGLFFKLYSPRLGCIGVICCASILPFFFHNVFGKKSKMFLGDGGSLLLGLMMVIFTFSIFAQDSPAQRLEEHGVSTAAIALAVLGVPVFDTLRVMFSRILHGVSPFCPDRNHLHHDVQRLGFSHLATTVSVIALDLLVLFSWRVTYVLGGSIDLQFYVVVAAGVAVTLGSHLVLKDLKEDGALGRALKRVGDASTRLEQTRFWTSISQFIDKKY